MRTLAEIGQELRQARETRGRTLDELASQTHLKASHLRAIEEGDESSLPEPVYIKSFIRKFAQAVGLPGEELANQYWETKPLPPVPEQKREFTLPWWIFPWVIAALLVGVVVYFIVAAPREVPEAGPLVVPSAPVTPAPASPSATASATGSATGSVATSSMPAATGTVTPAAPALSPTATPVAKPTPAPTRPASPQPSPAALAPTPSPTPAAVSVAPGEAIRVKLVVEDASWVQVTKDGASVYRGTLRPGETMSWSAERELAVTLGNAGGVEVLLSDRPLGKLGAKGEVVRRAFKRGEF